MRRWFERWLPDDSYLTRQLWFPLQCLIAGFHHPHRTTANTGLALLTTAATVEPYRRLSQSGSAALDDLHLQLGCALGTRHLACGS